jgi:hypothetical protein
MPMCGPSCSCRCCDISKMAYHPLFRDRIDQMIEEYKRLTIGPNYFPIELT